MEAIFAENSSGDMTLIARTGDGIEVAPEDVRTVNSLRNMGGYDFGATNTNFNDAGQLPLLIKFEDGSAGFFLASTADAIGEVGTVTVKCRGKPGKGGGGGDGDTGGPPPGKGKK